MCVAIPMKITEMTGEAHGTVEFDGVRRKVNLRLLPNSAVGDYVLIHAGYAIEKISEEAAEQNIRDFETMKNDLRL